MSTSEVNLCRLIYFSSASPELTDNDVDAILEEAIAGNELRGITGLLAYDDFHFMQVLEGNEDAVNNLYFRIAQDPRHYDVKLVHYQKVQERHFQEWSMALARLPEVPGRYIDNLYGGFEPQLFTADDALKYFDMLRHYLQQAA